jgi:hypothetical protein
MKRDGACHRVYTNLDGLFWSRVRATRLTYKKEQGCCSLYLGWDVTGMGNKDFYAVQTGPHRTRANRSFLSDAQERLSVLSNIPERRLWRSRAVPSTLEKEWPTGTIRGSSKEF